jgi:hypothetical protein
MSVMTAKCSTLFEFGEFAGAEIHRLALPRCMRHENNLKNHSLGEGAFLASTVKHPIQKEFSMRGFQ